MKETYNYIDQILDNRKSEITLQLYRSNLRRQKIWKKLTNIDLILEDRKSERNLQM